MCLSIVKEKWENPPAEVHGVGWKVFFREKFFLFDNVIFTTYNTPIVLSDYFVEDQSFVDSYDGVIVADNNDGYQAGYHIFEDLRDAVALKASLIHNVSYGKPVIKLVAWSHPTARGLQKHIIGKYCRTIYPYARVVARQMRILPGRELT